MKSCTTESDVTVARNITGTSLVKTSVTDKVFSICQVEPGTKEVGFGMRCTAMGSTALKTCAPVNSPLVPNLPG